MDCILVSEFSELEGPVPLFRIPENAAPIFNVNDFVLRYVGRFSLSPLLLTRGEQDHGGGSPGVEGEGERLHHS